MAGSWSVLPPPTRATFWGTRTRTAWLLRGPEDALGGEDPPRAERGGAPGSEGWRAAGRVLGPNGTTLSLLTYRAVSSTGRGLAEEPGPVCLSPAVPTGEVSPGAPSCLFRLASSFLWRLCGVQGGCAARSSPSSVLAPPSLGAESRWDFTFTLFSWGSAAGAPGQVSGALVTEPDRSGELSAPPLEASVLASLCQPSPSQTAGTAIRRAVRGSLRVWCFSQPLGGSRCTHGNTRVMLSVRREEQSPGGSELARVRGA